jgi:hypothetical protein
MTSAAIWLRVAPSARSIANVRWRSVTPMASELKIINVAASMEMASPR